MVPEHEKLSVLKQLLSHDTLEDLQVETANLEQVYQHFLSLHELSAHGKQHELDLDAKGGQN